jgi:hypothetical protein
MTNSRREFLKAAGVLAVAPPNLNANEISDRERGEAAARLLEKIRVYWKNWDREEEFMYWVFKNHKNGEIDEDGRIVYVEFRE